MLGGAQNIQYMPSCCAALAVTCSRVMRRRKRCDVIVGWLRAIAIAPAWKSAQINQVSQSERALEAQLESRR